MSATANHPTLGTTFLNRRTNLHLDRRLKKTYNPNSDVKEFSVNKAALVWYIFKALKKNCALMCKDYTNLEIQQKAAARATGQRTGSIKDLEAFLVLVNQVGNNTPTGTLTQISHFFQSPEKSIRDLVIKAGTKEVAKTNKFLRAAANLQTLASSLSENIEQCGNNPETYNEIERQSLRLLKVLNELERAARERSSKLEREIL